MSTGWPRAAEMLDRAVREGVAPGAALLVGRIDDVVFEHYAGTLATDDPQCVTAHTVYDLSSLTKPLATVALLALLVARRALSLDARVVARVPAFESDDARRVGITIRDLVAHASGLPAHRRYFERLAHEQRVRTATRDAKRRIEAFATEEPLERDPLAAAVYSDVNFIVLGRIVEEACGTPLDAAFENDVAARLGLRSVGFIDLEAPRADLAARAAPCGVCPWRGFRVRGAVQDENAWAMGGVAGHAGLFGTARDVHRLAAEHVRAHRGEPSLFAHDVVREIWKKDGRVPDSTWAAGWDTPSPVRSTAGHFVSNEAVGHLGFTGTSLWIDLRRGAHVVLLTNRLEYARDNAAIRALRPRLHDAVFQAFDEEDA
jgi:CubicO group peptidase (beta-lactamase class C family)